MLDKTKILDVGITNETNKKILEYLLQRLKKPTKFYIVTPNPELLVIAHKHKNYKTVLNSAEVSLADGTGLFMASIFLGKPLKQRIPGVDFLEFICKNLDKKPVSIGFLGGRAGIAERVVHCLLARYPHLNIVYVSDEWSGDDEGFKRAERIKNLRLKKDENSKNHKSYILNHKSIDLLFVALGSPKQEEWIYKNLDHIPVKAAMGVGGAFDFIAGEASRAPRLIRIFGFEWLYRLFQQPWRARRQLALITFIKLVLRERFGKKS